MTKRVYALTEQQLQTLIATAFRDGWIGGSMAIDHRSTSYAQQAAPALIKQAGITMVEDVASE